MTTITRRSFLQNAGLLTAAGAAAAVFQQSSSAKAPAALPDHPNLLIIITDQERQITSDWPEEFKNLTALPGRKALADHGLTFTNHFCNSAMCSPSRATIFTGLYAPQHGVIHTLTYNGSASASETSLSPALPNLATVLQKAGYTVVLKGKWHLSKHSDGNPPDQADVAAFGFADWTPTTAGEATDPADFGGGCADNDLDTLNQALAFLERADLPQPFCLVVGFANPHDVLAYPKLIEKEPNDPTAYKNSADYNQGITALPHSFSNDNLSTKPDCQKQSRDLYAVGLGTFINDADRLKYLNFYAYLHKVVDSHIQTLLNKLNTRAVNSTKLIDSTIVVRMCDHGEMGQAHGGLRQKMFEAYEESIRVPYVISNPVLFDGAYTNDSWVSSVDFLPTITSLLNDSRAGIPNLRGTDRSAIVRQPNIVHEYDTILYTFDDDQAGLENGMPMIASVDQPNHIRCIRHKDAGGTWKYARYFDPTGSADDQFEMYHLYDANGQPVDPYEEKNIANPAVTGYDAAKLSELNAILDRMIASRLGKNYTFVPQVQK